MKTANSETRIQADNVVDPRMSETPRRISAFRSVVLAALVLTGLGFATAVYFDNSDGSLTDAEGVISKSDAS